MSRSVLIAHARKKGRIHRGGGRRYGPMKNDILRFAAQETSRDVFFTSMIDLYAIHADFPGLDHAEKMRHLPYERVQFLENAWRNDIADPRFLPFIQLHEFEAYLFAAPAAFDLFYANAEKQIARLQAIADSRESPELINDGQDTAPSKRIAAEIPDYAGGKATIGPQVGARIGLDTIRGKCPHFDTWLTSLENLGQRRAN